MIEGIGIDIGGVLAEERIDRSRRTIEDFMEVPEIEGAFDAVRHLVDGRFGDRVYVISKVGEETEVISRAWMKHHEFSERTGMAKDHLIYCRRTDQKAPIAAELGLTHFVDNSLEVLHKFGNGERLFLFQPKPKQLETYAQHIGMVTVVQSWQEIATKL